MSRKNGLPIIYVEPGKPIIEIDGLRTELGGRCIHSDLDLTINSGEIVAIVGGSGSGKTTLLRAMLKLIPMARGTIKIFGQDINKCDRKVEQLIRANWGVMFQHGALFSSLTVLENVMFPMLEHTDLDKKTARELALLKLTLVGLDPDAGNLYPAELSGGMQKRVAIARAIALDPQLLILDEPTAGLDPQGASALDELVLELRNNLGLTVVMVTHDLDTLWRVTDRVAFLGEGKVLEIADMKHLSASDIGPIHSYFSDPRSRIARTMREET